MCIKSEILQPRSASKDKTMMKSLKAVQAALLCFICISPAVADPKAQIVFEAAVSPEEKTIQKDLEKSKDIVAVEGFINDTFKLDKRLSIVFGGDNGPLYDPETNEIIIPIFFIKDIKEHFKKAKYAQTGVSVDDAVTDALIHTIFHELAHALVAMYHLPVVGKEEDAADALATILLIDSFENGQEIAISAADLFDLESEVVETLQEEDFWGEHSFDAKRYYSTICLVYGSSPEKYSYFLKEEELPQDWADRCLADFDNTSNSWYEILDPYMKHNK